VAAVEDEVWAKDTSQPRPKYHIWVDTLCCPVAKLEPYYNKISLLRMKTVYEQATHVLVLDLALSMHNAEELRPATLLLRIFGSSIWMRRLWTLQGRFPFTTPTASITLTMDRGRPGKVHVLSVP